MSGPKVIDYQAVERQRAETARRQWLALCGRAEALSRRCVDAGHPQCAVLVRQPGGATSADLEAACAELERALTEAAAELERRQFADRTRTVASGLQDVLADLEQREQEAVAEDAATPVHRDQRHGLGGRGVDYADKVTRQLASLRAPSAELEQAAQAVLTEADTTRARLLYDDLKQRIARAIESTRTREAFLTEIAGLRGQLGALADPEPLRVLLDHAERAAGRGDDVTLAIRQARAAIAEQLDIAAAAADRQYVRCAVAESLSALGYDVADVDLVTPETLVFQQNSTHGVRADIRDGQIDVRTVRLGSAAGGSSDRDADEEFCARVPGLLDALADRGITARITKSELPGLYAPETIPLKTKGAPGAEQAQQPTVTRRRTAR